MASVIICIISQRTWGIVYLDEINTLPAFGLRLSQFPIELENSVNAPGPHRVLISFPGVVLQQRFADIPEGCRCPNG